MLPSARPQNPARERASSMPFTGTSLPPAGELTLSVMNFETGRRPAPDTASRAMQGRAYTPFGLWSHEQAGRIIGCHVRAVIDRADRNGISCQPHVHSGTI